MAKAADDRMAACMADELRKPKVAVVSLYPGLVRTESVCGFTDVDGKQPRHVCRKPLSVQET